MTETRKYNLVGNGCFSTFCTRDWLKHEYVNPFIWCLITFPNMFKLISNWDKINFNNIKIRYNEKDNNYTIILLDFNIELLYLHYKLDKNAKEYTVKGNDGFYYDMENFLVKRWFEHIERMKGIEPIFCVMQTNDINLYTTAQLQQLKSIKSSHPIIIHEQRMGNTKGAEILYGKLKAAHLVQ